MEIKSQTINAGNQLFTDSEITLHTKLSIKEQESILSELFGFSFDGNVLIDDDGREFYGMNINDKFDLSTLNGIFTYAINRAKNQGYIDCQFNIRHHLGLD